MNYGRIPELLLLLISAGTVVLMSQQALVPLAAAGISLVALAAGFRGTLSRPGRLRVHLAIGAVFLIKWLLFPPLRVGALSLPLFSIGVVDYNLAYNIAQAFLVCQAFVFLVDHGSGKGYLPGLFAILVMTLVGTIPPGVASAARDAAYQGLSVALSLVIGCWLAFETVSGAEVAGLTPFHRRAVRVLTGILLFAVAGTGWALGKGVYRYGEYVDRFLGAVIAPVSAVGTFGFSNKGEFGTIGENRFNKGESTALRVFSDTQPPYLVGRRFDTYEPPRWTGSQDATLAMPVSGVGLRKGTDPGNWFRLWESAKEGGRFRELRISPSASAREALFTPADALYVGVAAKSLYIDVNGLPQPLSLAPGESYAMLCGLPRWTLNPAERERLLALPEGGAERIRALAGEIAEASASDGEKMAAVVRYLGKHYRYDLGGGPVQAPDPASAFLFDDRQGHCEFFASGAVLLLRGMGIPSRYVTGYVPAVRNSMGGYWVARKRDAHAWAEAYLAGTGWITVEATPPSGVPALSASWGGAWMDYVLYLPQAVLAAFRDGQSRVLASLLLEATHHLFPGLVLVAVLGLGFWGVIVGLRRRLRRSKRLEDVHLPAFHRALARMDRRVSSLGVKRGPGETLHAFAKRLAESGHHPAAEWYRHYAEHLYNPHIAEHELALPPLPRV